MEEVPSRFEQLWSIEQAADHLALSTKTLYGWRVPEVRPAELPPREQGEVPARGSAGLGRRAERVGVLRPASWRVSRCCWVRGG